MSQSSTLASQISVQLTTAKCLTPNQAWLSAFIRTQRPTTPLPVLTQTALFRLLASDIADSLAPDASSCFPSDIHNAGVKERQVKGPVVAQVLAVEDMSRSRWEQIEAIESLERGEGTKGREIIRILPPEQNAEDNAALISGGGPHKLLMQDAKGTKVYGIEFKGLEGVGLGMSIGSKMVLTNVRVARGMILLEPGTTTMLGGKIEALHKIWKENRKAELKAAIEASERL